MIIDSVSPGLTYSLFHQFPRAPLCRMQYSRRPPAQHAAPTWPPSLLIIIVTVAGYIAAISRLIARLFALFPRFCPRPARAISRTCRRSVFFIRQRTAETCRMSSRVKPETCRVLSYGGRRQTKNYLYNRQSGQTVLQQHLLLTRDSCVNYFLQLFFGQKFYSCLGRTAVYLPVLTTMLYDEMYQLNWLLHYWSKTFVC